MQSPAAALSLKCIVFGLVLGLLLSLPVFLMMAVDVKATAVPQIAHANTPHHAAPPASHP